MSIWDKTLSLSDGRSARKAKQKKVIKRGGSMVAVTSAAGVAVANKEAVTHAVSTVDLTGGSLFVIAAVMVIHLIIKLRNKEEF